MNHPNRAMRGRIGTMLLLLCLTVTAPAADLDVRTASLGFSDDAWRLTARIDYQLTPDAVEALENGVPLTFRVEVEIARVRRWLPNAVEVSAAHDWQLGYDPLSERYQVRYPGGREASVHATLFGALNAMGRVQSLAVADASALKTGEAYQVAVRAELQQRQLPAPLWYLGFWRSGLSLTSDWYQWTLMP